MIEILLEVGAVKFLFAFIAVYVAEYLIIYSLIKVHFDKFVGELLRCILWNTDDDATFERTWGQLPDSKMVHTAALALCAAWFPVFVAHVTIAYINKLNR